MSHGKWENITQIKRANKALGHHFFDRDAMTFFRSRVYPHVYGGRFFITSEQFVAGDGEEFPREYTVREARPDGTIDTVDMPKFKALADATARVEILVRSV